MMEKDLPRLDLFRAKLIIKQLQQMNKEIPETIKNNVVMVLESATSPLMLKLYLVIVVLTCVVFYPLAMDENNIGIITLMRDHTSKYLMLVWDCVKMIFSYIITIMGTRLYKEVVEKNKKT